MTKVIAVYYCNESNEVKIKSVIDRNDGENRIEDLELDEHNGGYEREVEKLRTSQTYFRWYNKDELPFDKKVKKQTNQVEIFREIENVVLSVAFINEHDRKNDLIFFYFKKNLSNIGVSESTKELTSENKLIIGTLLHNSIKTIIENAKNDLVVLNFFNENTKSLVKRYNQIKDELERSRSNYGHNLVDLCKAYVKECSNGSRFKYILTEDALNKIKNYQGDITALKILIKNAISFVNNLYFDSNKPEIYISEDYLNFESNGSGAATKPQEVQLYDTYSKTIILLDKLEKAARFIVAKNLDMTSANVGNAFTPPISAPAISDALKKHRNKILTLMLKKHPERWDMIKKNFRPIKNILNSLPGAFEKSA